MGRAWVLKEGGSLGSSPKEKRQRVYRSGRGRPFIVREYENVQGFWLAKQTRARSSNWLTGRSELTIDYEDYEIVRNHRLSDAMSHRNQRSSGKRSRSRQIYADQNLEK